MRRAVLLAAIVLTATGVAVSTGAFNPDQPADRAGDIALQPTSEYAYLENTSDGEEIVVDIDGVNINSVTVVGDVFEIYNEGNESAEVWITDQPDGMAFEHNGQRLNESQAQIVAPNTSVSVGVTVDTTGTFTSDGDFTVRAVGAEESAASSEDGAETVTVQQNGDNRTVEIINPTSTTTIPFDNFTLSNTETTVEQLSISAANNTTLTVSGVDPTTLSIDGATPIGAVSVTETTTPPAIDSGTVQFGIDPAVAADEDLVAYRQSDEADTWTQLDAPRIVSNTNNRTIVAVDTPGFSTIAVATATESDSEASSTATDTDDSDDTSTARTSEAEPALGSGEQEQPDPARQEETPTTETPSTDTGASDTEQTGGIGTIETAAISPQGGALILGLVLVTIAGLTVLRRRR